MATDVFLEPFGAAHLEPFAAMAADPDVLRFTRFPDPPQRSFPTGWLARYEAGRAEGTREAFAILDAGGAFLGIALAPEIDREAAEAELGYAVVPAARGRGIATAAVRMLTRWAFAEAGLLRVTLIIDAANAGSCKVAERCGYVREGVRRNAYVKPGIRADTIVYSRLPSDPEPSSDASGAPQPSRSAGGGTL